MPAFTWQITGGDLLTLVGILGAGVIFVQRLSTRISVQHERIVSLERRMDMLDREDLQGVRERGDHDRAMDDRLDRKQDKK